MKCALVHSLGLARPTCLSQLCEFDLVTDALKLIRISTIKACYKLIPSSNHNAKLLFGPCPGIQNGNQSVAVDWIDAGGS